MVFERNWLGGKEQTGRAARISSLCAAGLRWATVSGTGIALSLGLVASMASAYLAGSTLASSRNFMPQKPLNLTTGRTVQSGKADRPVNVTRSVPPVEAASKDIRARFEAVATRVARTQPKLARAFQGAAKVQPATPMAEAAPLNARFEVASVERQHAPLPARFGQRSEIERSSRLALALAGSESVELAYAVPYPSVESPFNRLFVSPEGLSLDSDESDLSVFEDLPEGVPLPSRRPLVDSDPAYDEPARTHMRARSREEAPSRKPAKPSDRSNMVAFAKPDNPRNRGGLFSLFSRSTPRAREGVAVYDISAATVTLPDGTRLEAHSGLGHMADNVKYVDQKMRGPTPPGTYKLTMREALFHGVEAIRLTPVDGKNPYGRNGLLAHTELLRGRPGQSNGCIAFKDYNRFLQAFKKGKIKRLIVVPGRNKDLLPPTAVADNGRKA